MLDDHSSFFIKYEMSSSHIYSVFSSVLNFFGMCLSFFVIVLSMIKLFSQGGFEWTCGCAKLFS